MIVGNDISAAQGKIDWDTFKNNSNFAIAKATEGVGFIDAWYGFNRLNARRVGLPFGSYHFARPDLGNTPQQEANFFCSVIDGGPILPGETLFLDFEVNYGDPVNWCKAWLDYVSMHFNGIKPMIYLNQSTTTSHDWSPVVNAGYALWIAAYTGSPTSNNFTKGAWPGAAMQQWTSSQHVPGIANGTGNVDGDVFFGSVDQLKAYGFKSLPPVMPEPPKPPEVPPVQPPVVQPEVPQNPTTPTVSSTNTPPTTISVNKPPVISNATPKKISIFQRLLIRLIELLESWKKN